MNQSGLKERDPYRLWRKALKPIVIISFLLSVYSKCKYKLTVHTRKSYFHVVYTIQNISQVEKF